MGEAFQQLFALRARSRATQHRMAARRHPRSGDVGGQDPPRHHRAGDPRPALDGLPDQVLLGDDDVSERWRSQYLYSRAATIYGGSSEIQRNIVARRLLDLGVDR